MRSARSLPYARGAALAGCLTLASLYACSDRQPTATTRAAATEIQASGAWTSTVWSVGPAGLTYSAGVTGFASAAGGGKRLEAARGSVHALSPSAAELKAGRDEIQGSLLRVPTLPDAAPARAGTPTLRMALGGARTFDSRTPDGKVVRTQLLDDSRRGARRSTEVLISVGGQPNALIQYRYARDGARWRLLAAQSTLFGADGRPNRVVASDFRGMTVAKVQQVGALGRVLGGAGRLAGSLASLVGPAPLCAQSNCDAEQLAWAQAHDAVPQADWALRQAYQKCNDSWAVANPYPRPYPDPCDQPLLDAQAAYDMAVYNLSVAQINLDQCYAAPPSGGGGGGGGGGGQTCYLIVWEISYDGGNTWEYLDSEYYCQNQI
jgi:hypothetical protein